MLRDQRVPSASDGEVNGGPGVEVDRLTLTRGIEGATGKRKHVACILVPTNSSIAIKYLRRAGVPIGVLGQAYSRTRICPDIARADQVTDRMR